MDIIFGILIPFIGTSLGVSSVFFLKDKLNSKLEKILLGFAAGVMIAASIWSLIIPSIDLAIQTGKIAWFPATIGFTVGILILLIIDNFLKKIECKYDKKDLKSRNIFMMIVALTLHNIPEGIAVGVAFAGALSPESPITVAQAIVLSIGVGIQNFPEGAITSLPLRNNGMSMKKSFIYGILSGIVEPIATVITIWLTSIVVPLLPYFLAFAAGAMFYVVINELIPETNKNDGVLGTMGFTIGFLLMMILDVSLG